jgi:magnesium transporter
MRRRTQPGAPPGVLHVDPEAPQPIITALAYSPDNFIERELHSPEEVRELLNAWPIVWVNVDGLGNAKVLHELGKIFRLHPLALEDVVNVHQRAKLDHYGEHDLIITHMVEMARQLETEQVSLFFGKNFVLTFQEDVGDCLNPVRERIRQHVGNLRTSGPDYLAYCILDAIVDHYFPVLEAYGEILEDLEERILSRPDNRTMSRIHALKREMLSLRRSLWPMRDVLNTLLRDPLPGVSEETRFYFRDCYDHVVRLIDLLETYRELGSDMMELQLSTVSNRTNEVMRVLTVIATIFIPLTFLSSIWGMNFDGTISPWNMPELRWRYGYPAALSVMLVVAAWLLIFFWRKGWLGGGPRGDGPRADSLDS